MLISIPFCKFTPGYLPIHWLWKMPEVTTQKTMYHMRDKKKCVKRILFHRKACNARDALRMSKTEFWEEKGTFEICLSREKGTIFSQSFVPNLYHDIVSAREAKVDY